ncbi:MULTISPECIES: DNA polymerase III subunit alpha [unclassified Pseudactinotalea]|uniref:DNA polymerase III subunit alpha n=1 Tax=unclassified Pseudactinotalea TaxID=2649176 RepID=UPI00128B001E|nr:MULTISPECIES: DNA polymerase III subunit alpha [unclassified Pseudactinotalea]MPV49504.1 DNA polymerase III subunit alpha [Pseudactinotalea sp. HY160]QGH69817.1 DNA polymerase III subunit alpha [Pseudactinotalea sp. HY158]
MSSADFVHLHVHTEYSMLDGAARLDDLFAEAQRLGQTSLAMTDHGYLFGAYDFWRTARKHDIKPIIGVEAYVTPGTSRFDKTRVRWGEESQRGDDVSGSGAYTHMTLLAENTAGMHNLFRMSSLASLEGQLGKWPRIDRDLLQRYSGGLIGTSGCASGEVQVKLRLGQREAARRAAGEMQDILGKDNFFIEIMDHGADIERRTISELLELATELDAPLLATNDLHYTRAEDAHSHEALLCVQSASTLMEPTYDQGGKRFAFSGQGYYLKSAAEMRSIFPDHPQACDNTLLVAERCDVSFTEEVGRYMPHYPVPEGEDEISTFVKAVEVGLHRRYAGAVPDDVDKQARYEIEVITSKGYAGYYLVVADFINWAKDNGIRVGPGRGSGAGSMAAYAMGITDLDPLQHGLIFERFLNPERMSLPDFDIDFDERRRGEVIKYVSERYGEEQVSYIVTYGTIKAKQALKDSARVLGYEFSMGERLTKALPAAVMGKDITLSGTHDPEDKRYAEAGDFRELISTDPDAARVFDTAKGLENLKRQWGVHAAGVIIASEPLIDIIPIMRRPQDGAVITQIDFPAGEDLGLVKMDFLGLRNLTILDDALENIRLNGKEPVVIEDVALDDRDTYALLSRGETLGVFQLDGGGMRTLLRQMRPDNFEDISAVGALYRPGPMGANSHTNYALRKNGLQPITPLHPGLAGPLDDILGTTYGLIVYQEQVMEIAQKLAGYTLGQADLLRRAMGKKKKEVLDAEYIPFSGGMRANGYTDAAIQALWDVLVPFSDYAFNKAHSAAYGVVSYWTAYLKANYPVEYMAALLTSTRVDKDKSALYLNECRHMRITVLPPDVNDSVGMFTAVGADIRFGMAAVRNVGENVVAGIIAAREEKGAFTSFSDFLEKVPAQVCNKRTIESLIKAGAFDSLGHTRRSLLMIYEQAIDAIVGVKRKEAEGQFDLFASLDGPDEGATFAVEVPDLPEWEKKQKLTFEREMLGLYVSDHPLAGIDHVLEQAADCSIATLNEDESRPDGSQVSVAGLITAVDRRSSKAGRPFAIVTVEDMTGSIEIMFFGETYLAYTTALAQDTVIIIKGRVRRRDEEMGLHAVEVTVPDVIAGDHAPVRLTMPTIRCTEPMVERLRGVLTTHPGGSEVQLWLTAGDKATIMRLDDGLRVERNAALFGELKALLGPNCLN